MEWIKIGKEYPEDGELIWICSIKHQEVTLCIYNKSFKRFFDKDGNVIIGSHWTKIEKPEPPKQ